MALREIQAQQQKLIMNDIKTKTSCLKIVRSLLERKKRRDPAISTIQQHRDYIFMVENYTDYDIWDVQNYET